MEVVRKTEIDRKRDRREKENTFYGRRGYRIDRYSSLRAKNDSLDRKTFLSSMKAIKVTLTPSSFFNSIISCFPGEDTNHL